MDRGDWFLRATRVRQGECLAMARFAILRFAAGCAYLNLSADDAPPLLFELGLPGVVVDRNLGPGGAAQGPGGRTAGAGRHRESGRILCGQTWFAYAAGQGVAEHADANRGLRHLL